jgi:hypothetical protein
MSRKKLLAKLRQLPKRCRALTTFGVRCKMHAEPGKRLCRYHHPQLRAATIERNRVAYRAWQARKAATAVAGEINRDLATNAGSGSDNE